VKRGNQTVLSCSLALTHLPPDAVFARCISIVLILLPPVSDRSEECEDQASGRRAIGARLVVSGSRLPNARRFRVAAVCAGARRRNLLLLLQLWLGGRLSPPPPGAPSGGEWVLNRPNLDRTTGQRGTSGAFCGWADNCRAYNLDTRKMITAAEVKLFPSSLQVLLDIPTRSDGLQSLLFR